MKNEGTKNIILGVLIVGLVSMTVAFAALSTNLSINNTAEVAAQSWDVELANWAKDNSTGTGVDVTTGSIGTTSITGFKFGFSAPGQSITYNFNIVNKGTINAKNTAVTVGTPKCYTKTDGTTKGAEAASCPITFTVNCASTALTTNANGYSSLDLTGTTTGTPVTAGTKACTYTVTLNASNDTTNSYNQPRVLVEGLNVSWDYAQN